MILDVIQLLLFCQDIDPENCFLTIVGKEENNEVEPRSGDNVTQTRTQKSIDNIFKHIKVQTVCQVSLNK